MLDMTTFNPLLDEIEHDDSARYHHLEHVAMMAYCLGKEFGVSTMDLERLYSAGMLHELGDYQALKIVDPEKISSAKRWFPMFSAHMVATVPAFSYVARIISQYAENFDGTGGPFGLKGNAIHVYSVFVRIVDVYDHARMAGKTHDESTVLLRSMSDKVFPRQIITPFIKMLINNPDVQFYSVVNDR